MARTWAEAKELFDKAKTPKEKLQVFMDDIWAVNLNEGDMKWNLFRGKISKVEDNTSFMFVKDLKTFFSNASVINPYSFNPVRSFLLSNKIKEVDDEEDVVFTVKAGKGEEAKELLTCDKIVSFRKLGIQSKDIAEILEHLVNIKFVPQYENEIVRYVDCLKFPKEFEEFQSQKTTLASLGAEIEEKKAKLDDINVLVYNKQEELKQVQTNIDTIKIEKEQLDQEKTQATTTLEIIRKTIGKETKRLKWFLGAMNQDSDDSAATRSPIHFDSESAPPLQIFKNRLRYNYSDDLLISFLMALNTNQIITLFGKPGTGKTSFVMEAARALGAKLTMISVQNNWTDSSDLLGYYSPINSTYESTRFVEALLDAQKDWLLNDEKTTPLHIICLDEMNLARVEYYFAEFLSLLQMDASKQIIHLLPKHIEDEISRQFPENQSDEERQAIEKEAFNGTDEKVKKLMTLKRYKHFSLPPNIRFVGTINNDDTTNALSPKVIDRSFYLEIQRDNASSVIPTEQTAIDLPEEYDSFFPASFFPKIPNDVKFDVFTRENHRLNKYAREMWPLYQKVTSEGNEDDFCERIIISKILPSIKKVDEYNYDKDRYAKAFLTFDAHKLNSGNGYNYLGG